MNASPIISQYIVCVLNMKILNKHIFSLFSEHACIPLSLHPSVKFFSSLFRTHLFSPGELSSQKTQIFFIGNNQTNLSIPVCANSWKTKTNITFCTCSVILKRKLSGNMLSCVFLWVWVCYFNNTWISPLRDHRDCFFHFLFTVWNSYSLPSS